MQPVILGRNVSPPNGVFKDAAATWMPESVPPRSSSPTVSPARPPSG